MCAKTILNPLIIAAVAALVSACGGNEPPTASATAKLLRQNNAGSFVAIDSTIPTHAIAGKQQVRLAASLPPATISGPRANYYVTKTSTGYSVFDTVGLTTLTFGLVDQIVFSDMTINLGIGDKSQTIAAADLQSLIELYIAYFNRVPDADGLSYWIDQLKAGQSIDQIGTSFYNAAIQYSTLTGYASTMSDSDFITIIYKNVLGRTSIDSGGMAYWSGGLKDGSQTRGTLVRTILGSAHTFKGDATYGYVADLLDNKDKLANFFTVQQGLNYNTAQDSIMNTMAMVAAITPTATVTAVLKLGNVDWGFREVPNATFSSVPIPVQKTSYLNFKTVNLPAEIAPVSPTFVKNEGVTSGIAYGDFFQEGTVAMIAASNVFTYNPGYGSTDAGRIYFFHTDGKGGWVDQTSKILGDGNRTGCISPRKIVVADFNGDGKPDAFIACHGIDGNIPAGYTQGEHPRYILSQADGTYKNVDAGFNCYCHGATAADFNGDGFADIIVASPPILSRLVYLKNNKNGTFTDSPSLIPASTIYKSIWSLEFVDVNGDGKFDLALYGSEHSTGTPGAYASDWQPTFFINDGRSQVSSATPG